MFSQKSVGLLCILCLSLWQTGSAVTTSEDVVALTDANFDRLTSRGEWLIDIYAPWCPHCRQLDPVWQAVARRLRGRVNVAKVNGDREKALVKRFGVQAYPSIYFVKGADTWEYSGPTYEPQLEDFAIRGWREAKPLSYFGSPTSAYGRALGVVFRVPAGLRQLYMYLRNERRWSELFILAAFLAVPVLIGMLVICMLDMYYSSRKPWDSVPQRHEHAH